jgi:hypothetical protein
LPNNSADFSLDRNGCELRTGHLSGLFAERSERVYFCLKDRFIIRTLPMSVSATSIFHPLASHSRYRDIEPFRPNQSMKPTAHWRNKFSVFATTPYRGLSLSR